MLNLVKYKPSYYFPGDYPQIQLETLTHQVASAIGDAVFAIDGFGGQSSDLVSVVDHLMAEKGHTLAVVETISQGLLAAKMIGMPWLLSAVYEQSIATLTQRLSVKNHPDDLITTAKALADAVQKSTGANMVLIQLTASDYYINPHDDKAVTVTSTLLADGEYKYKHAVRSLAGDIKRKQHQAALVFPRFIAAASARQRNRLAKVCCIRSCQLLVRFVIQKYPHFSITN